MSYYEVGISYIDIITTYTSVEIDQVFKYTILRIPNKDNIVQAITMYPSDKHIIYKEFGPNYNVYYEIYNMLCAKILKSTYKSH